MEHRRPTLYSPPGNLTCPATQVLDTEKKGYLTEDELEEKLSQGLAPFRDREFTNMSQSFLDQETRRFYYEDYVHCMQRVTQKN